MNNERMNQKNKFEWIDHSHLHSKFPENKELITIRANYTPSKKVSIRISIGIVICEVLDYKKGDRVSIFLNRNDRNILLVEKSGKLEHGHKLSYTDKSNFLTTDFIMNFYTEVKVKQTIICDYNFNNEKQILIDISNLRWVK